MLTQAIGTMTDTGYDDFLKCVARSQRDREFGESVARIAPVIPMLWQLVIQLGTVLQ